MRRWRGSSRRSQVIRRSATCRAGSASWQSPRSGPVEQGRRPLHAASGLHRLTAVTRGIRVASFFQPQGMLRDAYARGLIFDRDTAMKALVERPGRDHPETVKLTGICCNLICQWAEP